MDFSTDDSPPQIHLPADIDWEMLDKSKFFFVGAALFSGVSGLLYPMVVMKTRQQVASKDVSCLTLANSIFKNQGFRGFYLGFGTSIMGTIPARALYMGALEFTKSNAETIAIDHLGMAEASASASANAIAGMAAAMAAQLVWTPIDVISQRLMVQGGDSSSKLKRYTGGIDAFNKILVSDGVKGLYRGFGISLLTYAPSNAVWWASYSIANRGICNEVYRYINKKNGYTPDGKFVLAIQSVSAAIASGASALVTMPLDTVKTRLQVMEGDGRKASVIQTMRSLVRQGGWSACYRGFGPRWASMSMSATTMITTYELVKKLSAKNRESLAV